MVADRMERCYLTGRGSVYASSRTVATHEAMRAPPKAAMVTSRVVTSSTWRRRRRQKYEGWRLVAVPPAKTRAAARHAKAAAVGVANSKLSQYAAARSKSRQFFFVPSVSSRSRTMQTEAAASRVLHAPRGLYFGVSNSHDAVSTALNISKD